MAALPQMIPLKSAVKKVRGATIEDLRPLIEKGKIKGVEINGEIYVETKTLPKSITRKTDVPEYKKLKHLQGIGISLSAASRKYKVPTRTISRWKSRGLIRQVGVEKNRVLIDEQDIAYCAHFYHLLSETQGQWLFDSNGVPRTNDYATA